MPTMDEEGFFAHSLTYICEHDENGAMGLIVNRKLDMTIGDIFVQMNIDPGNLEIAHHSAHLGQVPFWLLQCLSSTLTAAAPQTHAHLSNYPT